MEMWRNVVFKFNKRIPMVCLLTTVLKVTGTFAQANYCSGDTYSMDSCLNKTGVFGKNTTEMPVNMKELDDLCSDFRKGMKCLQDFAINCLEETKRESFNLHFGPTVYIMKQLCENHDLRQEYLKYPNCHKDMSPEWERCSKPFIDLVHGKNASTKDSGEDKIFRICCTKFSFLDCINQVSGSKCGPAAATMHRNLAASLSGSLGTQYNCTHNTVQMFNSTFCKHTCSRSHRNSSSFLQVFGLFLTYVLLCSWRK